jgi:hypothetical protein
MAQQVVGQHHGEHGLGDGGGADADAGVVAALGDDLGGRLPSRSTVRPGRRMLLVGFNARRATMRWPVEMPPSTPPALLLRKPSGVISSRCSVPFCATEAKPAPISTPLTALMPINAWAMSASSRSKTGSPSPGGRPSATTVTSAPMESPDLRRSSM